MWCDHKGVTSVPSSHDPVEAAASMGGKKSGREGGGGGVGWGCGEVFGISLPRPIATGRGGFVYFPNSTERTGVGRRRGGGRKRGSQGGGTKHILFHTQTGFTQWKRGR